MPFATASTRSEPSTRSHTWPPTTVRLVADGSKHAHISPTAPAAMPSAQKKPAHDPFEDEINANPAAHFLSPVPMYEYEDWAEDSDEDTEEVEWDAGITDFALFTSDRRQSQERQQPVSRRWEDLLSSQACALQRAVLRHRADSDPKHDRNGTPLLEDMPQLTPDNSPNLRDSFDIDAYYGQRAARPSIPNYLNIDVTPPEELTDESDESDLDDDDLPVAFLVERARQRRRQARQLERPGMRFNRTMSGKVHVWRRPSWHIHDVREDAEAERMAELASAQVQVQTRDAEPEAHTRGRRR